MFGNFYNLIRFPKQNVLIRLYSNLNLLKPVKLSFTILNDTLDSTSACPLIILHGLFGSKQNWSTLSKAYRQRTIPQRKIIALDLRNHGESPHTNEHSYELLAEDVRTFLSDNHIEKISLMGHSMGGACAMLFALKYPQLIEKLIVVDMSPIISTVLTENELPKLFKIIRNVKMPDNNLTISQARKDVDQQLSEGIPSKSLRAFLLTNLIQSEDKSYKWRVNIPVLHRNYMKNIVRFPDVDNLMFNGVTLFVGGTKSDYIQYHENTKPKRLVYAVDLRNHGDSAHTEENNYDHLVMDTVKFIQSMFLNKVSLIGHGIGGNTAMLLSLKFPDLIEKLIVVDVSPITVSQQFQNFNNVLEILHEIRFPSNLTLHQARLVAAGRLVKVIKNHKFLNLILTNLIQRNYGSYSWQFNTRALLRNFENLSSFPQINNVKFNGPVLFIGGSRSEYLQKSDFPQILKLFPQAKLQYIDGAGHWVHADKPNEFLKLTVDFLNDTTK